MRKREISTQVTTRTETGSETGNALLAPDEEKVIRMRYGMSEADDKELEFAVGASEDSRLRLAVMEAYAIADLEGRVPAAPGSDPQLLARIVERYREV